VVRVAAPETIEPVAELQEIPEKPFYRTTEVCQLTDTQPYVLRFWESEFPQLAPDRARGGQSMYRRRDIDIIMRIKKLLYDDEFTIEGARRQLEQELSGESQAAREPAPVPRAAVGSSPWMASADPTDGDFVPRQRYEDAVEEVEILRLKVREAEASQRRAEARAQRLEESTTAEKKRVEGALARIDQLVARLSRRPSA